MVVVFPKEVYEREPINVYTGFPARIEEFVLDSSSLKA
jgi:hypothetical protein